MFMKLVFCSESSSFLMLKMKGVAALKKKKKGKKNNIMKRKHTPIWKKMAKDEAYLLRMLCNLVTHKKETNN